ncbi:major facilitator superfamily domain-containing protein [Cladochytrium replicatum]|nr:major facilitator superfamily domain-containing protein [Cladochytrium replicatum]
MVDTELVPIESHSTPVTLRVEDCRENSSLVNQDEHDGHGSPLREQERAPVDGGSAAWRLLCAAFVFETLLWGFPLAFGVFQDYYSKVPEFSQNRYISVVGTVASGLGYLGGAVIMPFIQRFQRWRKLMILVGWSICILSLVLGSFANTLETLILTQGIGYGVGFLTFYYPILNMVNEYWVARRGMAYGMLCAASGLSGSVMPFVLRALLEAYGYKTTLRAVAIGLAVSTGPFIPMLKGRIPVLATRSAAVEENPVPRMNWVFLRSSLFWVYTVSNLLQGFGYFFPALYLPSYASALGLWGGRGGGGSLAGALLLALMCISQMAGQFIFGLLSDKRKVPLDALAVASTIVAAVACLGVWWLAESLPVLAVFAIVYGFFGAGFTAIWARMSTAVTDDAAAGPIVFALFNFGKGIGNVLTGPIGGSLVSTSGTPLAYRGVIIFSGACMLASAFTIVLRRFNHLRKG